MIAKLSGTIDSLGDGIVVIDVHGVGYLVHCSGRSLANLQLGEPASLFIETHVREDAIQLFGFLDAAERHWFRLLNGVQGIGGKAALAILGSIGIDEFVSAVAAGDRTALSRAPGIGAKLAARVIAELRDKVGQIGTVGSMANAAAAPLPEKSPAADAVSALVNLGFRPVDAFAAVRAAAERLGGHATVEELIRQGLADLAPKERAP